MKTSQPNLEYFNKEMRILYKSLVRIPDGKGQNGRPMHRQGDDINRS